MGSLVAHCLVVARYVCIKYITTVPNVQLDVPGPVPSVHCELPLADNLNHVEFYVCFSTAVNV